MDVIPTVKQFLKEYLENGGPVINEEELENIASRTQATLCRPMTMIL
jgi:NFU1 iron-sulfur cluster scaffold homolog, mitochondrial